MVLCTICSLVTLTGRFKIGKKCSKCAKKCAVPDKCMICNENKQVDEKNTCLDCNARQIELNNKRPEILLKKFLTNNNNFPPFIHNKVDPMNKTLCSNNRVDFRMDYGYFLVIIEVDENSHRSYGESCELIRVLNIVNAAGGIPSMIFRLNPDSYKVGNKKMYTDLNIRFLFLAERIQRHVQKINRRISKSTNIKQNLIMPLVYVEYLFYECDEDVRDKVIIRTYKTDKCLLKSIKKCK